MRAIVDAKEFSQALDKVSRVLKKSGTLVLKEALVRFSEGRCILTGTDMDTWLTTEILARGDDFSFLFYRTADAAKVCRDFDGELAFELTEVGEGRKRQLKLCMSCGHRVGELYVLFPEGYLTLPEVEPEYSFTANAASLLKRINRIKYATLKAGRETDARSTCIQFSGNRIFCLDGLRAAWDTDELLTVPRPFMAPVASLEHLKLFGKQDVSVQLGDRYVDIFGEALHLQIRRTEAIMFDLDSAIPKQFNEEVYLYPQDFLAELSYLKELFPKGQKAPVCFDGGRLFMMADGCRYQTRVQMDGKSETMIGFSLNNLAEAVRQFKGERRVRMRLISPVSPVVLEAEGRNDAALVLPVRIKANMAA